MTLGFISILSAIVIATPLYFSISVWLRASLLTSANRPEENSNHRHYKARPILVSSLDFLFGFLQYSI